MEYFKSLKSVLGAPQDDQQPTAAETVCIYKFFLRKFLSDIFRILYLLLHYFLYIELILWCF